MLLKSNLDEADYAKVDEVAQSCKDACDAGNWTLGTELWYQTELVVWRWSNFIDFYNILKYVNPRSNPYDENTVRFNHGRKVNIPSNVLVILLSHQELFVCTLTLFLLRKFSQILKCWTTHFCT